MAPETQKDKKGRLGSLFKCVSTGQFVRAYLNPNPALRGETLVDPHGRKYKMKNDPFLELELHNFPKGGYNIQILSPFTIERKIDVTSSCFSLYFFDHRFKEATISQIRIKVVGKDIVKEFTVPTRVHRLAGKVQDFDGNPVSAYIWATRYKPLRHEIIVKTDDEGKYLLYYPEGRPLRVFVADTRYGKTILESWIMANELKGDIEINPHIGGNFELYEFRVWSFDNIWNIFFLPAIVDSNLPPRLRKEDIRVWINGLEGEIKSFTPHKVYYKVSGYYPAYIMSVIVDKDFGQTPPPIIIKALVDSPKVGKGEAWYIHY